MWPSRSRLGVARLWASGNTHPECESCPAAWCVQLVVADAIGKRHLPALARVSIPFHSAAALLLQNEHTVCNC